MTRPSQSVRIVALDLLTPNPANIRKDLGDLTDLAASIREHGIMQPIVVTEHPTMHERLLILAGARRAAAARIAGLGTVPVVVRHGLEYDDAEQTVVMLVENCQRSDLGPVEKADAIQALRDTGLNVGSIAKRIGMSASRVHALLQLQDLTPATRERVRDGQISVKQATTVVSQVRQTTRTKSGGAQLGRPIVVEPAHFTSSHPLAGKSRTACTHSTRPTVGSVACGQCWETTIRTDEADRT